MAKIMSYNCRKWSEGMGFGPLRFGILVSPGCNFILVMFLKAWSIQNFFSGGFITAIERKLAKRTSVHFLEIAIFLPLSFLVYRLVLILSYYTLDAAFFKYDLLRRLCDNTK